MRERGWALLPPAGEQPTDVTQGEAREPGRLPGVRDSVVNTRQEMQAMVLHSESR